MAPNHKLVVPAPWSNEALEGIRKWASALDGEDKQASSDMRFLATLDERDAKILDLRAQLEDSKARVAELTKGALASQAALADMTRRAERAEAELQQVRRT